VEIDRRKFMMGMSVAGGAAMGLMLSPAPWYLLRDVAFWTQNWSWVPTPLPGDPSRENSVCRMCGAGCGVSVRKVNDRLVRVDGNADHPVNRGSLCPLGVASLQMVYGPSRIETPLRRAARGASLEKISWQEAIRELAGRISVLRASEKSHALACISRNDNSTVNQLLERFLESVGSPNFIHAYSPADGAEVMYGIMHGTNAVAYDIENSRCILSFGCSLFEGWGSFGRMLHAYSGWMHHPEGKRPEIIQIEPNLSSTANQADRWIPIYPGTEAALALGIAHVLIRDRLHDRPFIEHRCFGFKDWKDISGNLRAGFESNVMARYSPQAVEKITKVPAREIEKLAHRFASLQPAIAVGGGGRGDRWPDMYALMAIHSLNALVGNMDKAGGFVHQGQPPFESLPPVKKDAEAERGLRLARCDGADSSRYPLTHSLIHDIDARQIEMLLIHETNPHYVLPERHSDLFVKVPYIVSLSTYMDESATRADLILPLPAPFERWDDQIGIEGFPQPVYNLSRPLSNPLFDTMGAGDIVIQVAHALGGSVAESFPWNSFAEILKGRAESIYEAGRGKVNDPEAESTGAAKSLHERYPTFSVFWRALYKNGCWFEPPVDHAIKTRTPTGKFEFYSKTLQATLPFSGDIECQPHYVAPALPPEGFDLLIMPEELVIVAGAGQGTPPFLLKQVHDNVLLKEELSVRINPLTAIYKRLEEGDRVVLESPRGKVSVRIHCSADVREGVVLFPLGFGHSAYDQFLRNKGVNAYQLLDAGKDPVSGLLCYRETPGKIRKA